MRSHRYDADTVILIPITQVEIENSVSAGIQLNVYCPGVVPFYEEHEARLERGIGLSAWAEMDPLEKALVIAMRRSRIAQQNLQADAEIRNAKRNAKTGRTR